MNSPRIIVIGSSNTDLVVRLERLPQPGETLLGGDLVSTAGGKGANQSVAAARAGGRVTFVATRSWDDLKFFTSEVEFCQKKIRNGKKTQ